jgi:hypothetical protein
LASSINASTTAGVVTTADTSGVLNIQTAGVTAISIDASQAVSFTNAPTVTGGTANGVAYLNGSKVLTTGSALSFDGSVLATSVSGSTALTITSSASQAYINLRSVATAGFEPFIGFGDASAGNIGQMLGINGGGLRWTTGGTERMRLDASGRLGIGTTSPSTVLSLASSNQPNHLYTGATGTFSWGQFNSSGDASINNGANANLLFATNNTERARIDSSGSFIWQDTTSSITSGKGVKFVYDPTNPYIGLVQASSTSANNNYHLYSTGAGAFRFFVDLGGTIHATSTSIAAISDASLKTNIKDLETGLTEVMALKPRRFDWINGDATNVAGFIAQEVEPILPELVMESMYSYDEDGNEIKKKNLKMGDILPTLVKAIQEQQALITQLQADVALLKGA